MPDIVLETTGLTKSFRGRLAVDNLNLRVREGDVYGFLGPNGAGKSTTIRMLVGLVRPSRGSASVLGSDIRAARCQALSGVGALVETASLYKYLTARQNLKMLSSLSGGCTDQRVDEVLDIVGLLDRADDKVKAFSHGMKQRLGIAQALIPNPRLVILDEPTSGLDPQGMKDVRELIHHLAREQGVTVFLSSHLLHEVEQVCTRVGIISRGRLVAEGDVDKLLHREVGVVELKVDDVSRAAQAVGGLDWLEVLSAVGDRVSIKVSEEGIPELTRLLVKSNIDVFAVVPKSMTLEDLFLEMIQEGGNADEAAGGVAEAMA